MKKSLFLMTMIVLVGACQAPVPPATTAKTLAETPKIEKLPTVSAENYWFQGKAEIAVYDVQQERYGATRPAQQVMVFVTEDFSKQKQVKLDDPTATPTDRQPVLKLNAVRRFTTGIYDYSMMLSVFQPIAETPENALKTTLTVQDWCGQVFQQINRTGAGKYRSRLFSYFESEGDADVPVEAQFLEDEIWTMLRLYPNHFEKGTATFLPSNFYNRLKHQALQTQPAQFFIENKGEKSIFNLKYTTLDRSLRIEFETAAPHRILAWEEFSSGKTMSRGSLRNILLSDYWTKNSLQFDSLRDSLSLHWF